jgi:hypothetical protein
MGYLQKLNKHFLNFVTEKMLNISVINLSNFDRLCKN